MKKGKFVIHVDQLKNGQGQKVSFDASGESASLDIAVRKSVREEIEGRLRKVQKGGRKEL